MRLLRSHDADARDTVQTFLDAMRIDVATRPAPAPSPRLAATLDGRRPLPAATGPVTIPAPAPHRSRVRRPLVPAAAAIAASTLIFGGLASAGALPNPVQHTSAQLGSHIGINLPGLAPHRPLRDHPVPADRGEPHSPAAHKSASTDTSTTRPASRATPTTPSTPAATAPTTPTVPTVPVLPLPNPSVPVVTLPRLGLPGVTALPPVSLPSVLPGARTG